VAAPDRILRVQLSEGALELEGFPDESLYVAIDKATRIAASEGWHDWRLIEGGRVLIAGDERGPR
jgi:hypothetical protein